jgi:hypothetical protein
VKSSDFRMLSTFTAEWLASQLRVRDVQGSHLDSETGVVTEQVSKTVTRPACLYLVRCPEREAAYTGEDSRLALVPSAESQNCAFDGQPQLPSRRMFMSSFCDIATCNTVVQQSVSIISDPATFISMKSIVPSGMPNEKPAI